MDKNGAESEEDFEDDQSALRPASLGREIEASISISNTNKRPPSLASRNFSEPTPEQYAQMNRSERKKHREQKRRRVANNGLDELMALLVEIDPSIKAEAAGRRMKARKGRASGRSTKASSGTDDEENKQLLNRVDLISVTVSVLDRLNRENKQQKLIIQQLTGGARSSGIAFLPEGGVPPFFGDRPYERHQSKMMPMVAPYLLAAGTEPHPQSLRLAPSFFAGGIGHGDSLAAGARMIAQHHTMMSAQMDQQRQFGRSSIPEGWPSFALHPQQLQQRLPPVQQPLVQQQQELNKNSANHDHSAFFFGQPPTPMHLQQRQHDTVLPTPQDDEPRSLSLMMHDDEADQEDHHADKGDADQDQHIGGINYLETSLLSASSKDSNDSGSD